MDSFFDEIDVSSETWLQGLFQPNSIILAISPANQDIGTSNAIKLANAVDPSGIFYLAISRNAAFYDYVVDPLWSYVIWIPHLD